MISSSDDQFEGKYSCRFIKNGDRSYKGELEIQKKIRPMIFFWKAQNINGDTVGTFKGIGLKVGHNQLAVSYWHL